MSADRRVSIVRWEPWELNGEDCWRCAINTGHGELSWVTRHGPGADALTTAHLRVLADAAEYVAREYDSGEDDDLLVQAAELLRRAIEALEGEDA